MKRFLQPLFLLLSVFVFLPVAQGQVTRDFAIDLKADVSASSPHITLSWSLRQNANITAQQVYRRLKGEVAWVSQATLTTTDTSWADTTAAPGVEYEYWMRRTYANLSPNTAAGYITAGYELPLVESRGKLLLVIDATMEGPLAPEIAQLKRDLTGDGWTVVTISAPRRDTLTDVTAAADTKALIKAAYDADPANVKQVYILGHVPVPYAGNSAWDGHGNHSGAWSADGFYADMDGTWTDSSVNNNVTANVRLTNIPGDGRLDQSTIPSTVELGVGRVDLVNMQRAPASNVTETQLLRRYLRKAHDFKFKQGAYATTERRVLIRDGFGAFGSEGFMRSGWAWGFTGVGRPPEVIFDEAPSGDWWTQAAANNYLMANGNGGGSYETCGSVGATADFGRRPFRAAFTSLFGSYFGDWDVTNSFLRSPLAGNATGDGLGLCCFWAGRPSFFMHTMATGDTLGGAFRTSMNSQFSTFSNPVYSPANFGGGGTHLGLMGDPSLRMHVVAPPRHLAASSASGSVSLTWAASAESGLTGYHVYRAASVDGPFTRLTTSALTSPAYVDSTGSAGTSYTYMVRVLKAETAPGGTYANLSLGEMATIPVDGDASSAPANASGLAVVPNSSVSAQLTWQDNSADETGFRIERKTGAAGAFAALTTTGPGTAAYTDAGPFTNNETYYYRVIAVNGAGDGIPSNEVSFDAVPGFFEFNETYTKVSKTAGTVQIPVRRFGGVNGAVTVSYATANSSATAGTHYTTASGTLSWADGESGVKFVPVPVTNTPTAQQPRQFRITLSSPSSGTGIGTYNAISVLIEDPTATLPGPWAQSIVGSISDTGLAVQAEGGISSTTIGGTGLSTAGTSEAGQFVYQTRTGDGVMTAFVPAASPAQGGARFAVMVRESATAGGTPMAGTAVSTASGTFPARQVSRTTSGGTAVFGAGVGAIQVPCWLRITRTGNSFQSEASTDGTTWINQGIVTVTMASAAQWGLFHTSDDRSGTTYAGNYQTASFQNVTFSTVSVPGPVGSFTASAAGANSVTLTWTAAPSAGGYRLERRAESSGTFAQIIDLPSGTLNFTDSALASDAAYEYRIYGYNSAGSGALSSLVRVTTTAPTVYASLEAEQDATIKGGDATTNFGAETVLRVGGTSSSGSLGTNSKVYLRFNLAGQPATATGATLRLCLAGKGNLAQSGYQFSSPLRMLPEVNDAWDESTIHWDNAPLNNTASNGFQAGTIALSTFSLSDPLSVPANASILTLNVPATTLNNNRGANDLVTLVMNTTTTGAWLEFVAEEHATLPAPVLELTFAPTLPKRPSFLTVVEGTGANLELAWTDNTTTETGFEIERRPAGGSFTALTTTLADVTAFSDATTVLGTTYEYRMRALSAAGNSAWTPVVGATAGGSTGPIPGERLNFANWAANRGLSDNPTADDDGDGLANVLEYVAGEALAGEITAGGRKHLTLTFERQVAATDVALIVEVAADLSGPWTQIDPLQPENQAAVVHLGSKQRITVKDPVPVTSSARRFMRLRAEPRAN